MNNNILNLLLLSTASLSSLGHSSLARSATALRNRQSSDDFDTETNSQNGQSQQSTMNSQNQQPQQSTMNTQNQQSQQPTMTNQNQQPQQSTMNMQDQQPQQSTMATQNQQSQQPTMATQNQQSPQTIMTMQNQQAQQTGVNFINTMPQNMPIFNEQVDELLPNGLKPRFVLPPLPFAYDALEPYIDEETMRIHHDRHHQTYINNLNNAIARYPELYAYTLGEMLTYADMLPSDVQGAIINNGGGHYNHSFFWNTLSPEGNMQPTGAIGTAINREFGSYSNFKRAMTAAALSVFGSGYAWLVLTPGGRLEIITTRNQDTPLPLNLIPLLTVDVWEHAYYLKHQNNRERYVENWFNVINWPYVNSIYEAAMQQ